jgi:hypothetical protein
MQINIQEVLNGGDLGLIAKSVEEGFVDYSEIAFSLELIASALAELHRVSSSYLQFIPGLQYVKPTTEVGINIHWNDKKSKCLDLFVTRLLLI